MEETTNYELAAAFDGDEELLDEAELLDEELLLDDELLLELSLDPAGSFFSVLAGAESLLDSPELSLTVFDPFRLSVR